MENTVAEAGTPLLVAGSSYRQSNSSVSVVQEPEDSVEVWSDAQETPDDDHGIHMTDRTDGDELDEEDLIRSASAPGIDLDQLTQKFGDTESKTAATTFINTTTLERTASSIASPLDSEPLGTAGGVANSAHQPSSQSNPDLFSNASAPSAPRSTHSLDVFQSLPNDRPSSPAPTYNSAGVERRNSSRRSVVDNRSNRISGFFSHFIHRRPERDFSSPLPSANRLREEREPLSTPKDTSRASSPAPTRSTTPPPSFPAPSLQELGLSLTAITAQLTPSHFNTPPTSGTFLKPHYLLLCHSQGLDVLPLVAPPAPQPYALVRRIGFKSVVVMEQRGVLVAIAGRRDGCRVYALEEVRRAVEWRVDVEIRREKERLRREESKKGALGGVDKVFENLMFSHDSGHGKPPKSPLYSSPTTPTPKEKRKKSPTRNRDADQAPPLPLPRAPTTRRPKKRHSHHSSDPPPYTSTVRPQTLQSQPSAISISQARSRSGSVSNVLAGSVARRRSSVVPPVSCADEDAKADWEHASSDDEAINMASAGASGSAALDERTSSMNSATRPALASSSSGAHVLTEGGSATVEMPDPVEPLRRSSTSTTMHSMNRRNRPPQLELSRTISPVNMTQIHRPPPSPTPTIWTLRQALSAPHPDDDNEITETPDPEGDAEDDEDEGGDSVSFAQMLMESRLPDLPPPGSRVAQDAIMIDPGARSSTPSSSIINNERNSTPSLSSRSRRRWSVLDGVLSQPTEGSRSVSSPVDSPSSTQTRQGLLSTSDASMALSRIRSADGNAALERDQSVRRPTSSHTLGSRFEARTPSSLTQNTMPTTPSHHRFLPRIITNAFNSRRFDDTASTNSKSMDFKRPSNVSLPPIPPAPKLEYIKLPGTKGSLMIKAVETAKKSFLAILCGEAGDKVELFAGTYRTTLGLSRTFLLPDPPRSFELQLQGDDLVEIFLIFPQSVFGLEPATVRVREVRIDRAERRAARRRARENRLDQTGTDPEGPALGDEDNPVNVRIGVTLSTTTNSVSQGLEDGIGTPPISRQLSESNIASSEVRHSFANGESVVFPPAPQPPYSTFQQLSFAPKFPLASIADDFVIPPTYMSFLEYRAEHEPEAEGSNSLDLANIQFSPPGLPAPPVVPPSKWYYCDPKGVVQGPWKASLMQTWYKDGLLPPDLPVRREEEIEYVLLKDLRAQCVDPTHPFRSPPPPMNNSMIMPSEPNKPLLGPISLLSQAKYYGPPALFFTTRGGFSTSIVDARGRSVLKGRLHWSADDSDDDLYPVRGKLGDVTRLEAFDTSNKALIVAIRQGGLEVADVGDAILKPGDLSRPTLPTYNPPQTSFNRRKAFTWRVGSPLSHFATGPISSVSAQNGKQHLILHKKSSLPQGKSPAKNDFSIHDDYEGRANEELLYLGRKDEDVYCCERTNGSFRILRLCPIPS